MYEAIESSAVAVKVGMGGGAEACLQEP